VKIPKPADTQADIKKPSFRLGFLMQSVSEIVE
jgi:hypothetical protein